MKLLFISDITHSNFARTKGAKDKKKRTLRNLAIGAGGLAVLGTAGYLALKGKKKTPISSAKPVSTNKSISVKSPITTILEDKPLINSIEELDAFMGASKTNISRKAQNKEKVQQRLNSIQKQLILNKPIGDRIASRGIPASKAEQADQRKIVQSVVPMLKKKKAYYSMGDQTVAEFGRRKGSKDKKKRKVSLVGRAIGAGIGAAGGGALAAAGTGIAGMYLAKKAGLNTGTAKQVVQQTAMALGDLKAAGKLTKLKKHRKAVILGGAAIGAGVGATANTEQLQEGRRYVSTANRTSQELRGYISLGKRYGVL
jgi:hypothetical protein